MSKRVKYDAVTVDNAATTKIVELSGVANVSRKVMGVNFEMADGLLFLIWKDQILVAKGNTAHYVETYGSATVYRARIPLDETLNDGDTLTVQLYNGTGAQIANCEVGIEYDE